MHVVLLAVSLGWLSCSGDDLPLDHPEGKHAMTLMAFATKANPDITTRGLSPDGDKISAIWSQGDQVTVQKTNGTTIGTMTPITTGSGSTKLKAALTSPVSIGDQLNLFFPREWRDYTGQKGTLADIASKYDYATASVTVQNVYGEHVYATDARFDNQQAIVKFNLRGADGKTPIEASSLTVSATGLKTDGSHTGDITITPAAPTSEIYAALSGISNQTVTLSASTDTYSYTYTTTAAKTFENSKYYNVTVKMTPLPPSPISTPLTLECATVRGATVAVYNISQMQYQINGGDWKSFTNVNQIDLKQGDKVSFRGNWARLGNNPRTQIVCTDRCYVYGNIMSLVDPFDYATKTDLPFDYTFQQLFKGLTSSNGYRNYLMHKDGYDLVLPATTLRKGCYFQMFYGNQYLDHIVCLATNISAENCTFQWLHDVGTTGTFVKAKGINEAKWPKGESGIPQGWTVQNQ